MTQGTKKRPFSRFRENEEDLFSKRIAVTQSLNTHSPLVSFYLSGKQETLPDNVVNKFPDLNSAIVWCTEQSKSYAERVTGNKKPSAAEIRPFRNAIANHLASCLHKHTLPDPEYMFSGLDDVLKSSNTILDTSPFKEFKPDTHGMLTFVSANVGMKLLKTVETYNFRQPTEDVLLKLTKAINSETNNMITYLLREETDADNKRNVAQTVLTKLSDLMVEIYNHHVHRVIPELIKMSEKERLEFLSRDQVHLIEEDFQAKANMYSKIISHLHTMPWDQINLDAPQFNADGVAYK